MTAGDPPEDPSAAAADDWKVVAVDAVDVGLMVLDDRGIRLANGACTSILGVPLDDLVGVQPGTAHFEVLDEEGAVRPLAEMGFTEALRAGRTVEKRSRLRYPDGRETWVSTRSVPFVLEGRPAVVCVLADVTSDVRAEDAARASQRQLQQILDAVDTSVFVKDTAGRYTFVNETFLRELALPAAEVLGRRSADLASDPAAAASAEAQDRRLFDSGEPVSDQLRLDGRTYLTTKAPLRDDSGRVYALVGVSTNITEQVRAVEAQAIAASVVQSSPDAILTFGQDRAVTSVNQAALALVGLQETEVVGRPADSFGITVPEGEAGDLVARVLAGESVEFERTREPPGQAASSFMVRLTPIRAAEGQVIGGAVIVRDISRTRQAEAERARMQHELEHVERLDSLGQLAGGIAHDFNNMLAAIRLTAEMLVTSVPESSPEHEHARRILEVSDRATELTDRMLVFARKDTPAQRRVDVNAVVRQADQLLARTLGEHIERRLELSGSRCVVVADPARLEQVVLNLAVNARDAMPGGGVLTVGTEVVDLGEEDHAVYRTRRPGPHVVLTVTDEGTGMDADVRRQAFEPFFTTKEPGQGTGLGLSSVYAVAHQVGGGTWIYSEPGMGTVVKVALPLVPEAADRQASPDVGRPASRGRGRRVLVVEDEQALRQVAERLLTRAGYEVQAFPDGTALLAALPGMAPPDVLLTDVVLPGPSGPEVADEVLRRHPGTAVVLMSGYTAGLVGDREMPGELLAKPFSSATLVAAIEQALTTAPEA